MTTHTTVAWSEGRWLHDPADHHIDDAGKLVVTATEKSDAWERTYYGFSVNTANALVRELLHGTAMEVTLNAAFSEQFDQAGIFVRAGAKNWVKAGLEFSDGVLQLGAVVTRGVSDWSVSPVHEWLDKDVVIRVSRHDDSIILRAGVVGEELRLVRVLPCLPDDGSVVEAGPFVCSPSRGGLSIAFSSWTLGPADASLH